MILPNIAFDVLEIRTVAIAGCSNALESRRTDVSRTGSYHTGSLEMVESR